MLFSTLLRREPFNWLIISPPLVCPLRDYINQASKRSRDSQRRLHKEQKVYAAAILPPPPKTCRENRVPNPPLATLWSPDWEKLPLMSSCSCLIRKTPLSSTSQPPVSAVGLQRRRAWWPLLFLQWELMGFVHSGFGGRLFGHPICCWSSCGVPTSHPKAHRL